VSERISYRDGTHRICSPDETLANVLPLMASMGITRIADVTGLDTVGIPVVMVYRPNSRSLSVSQGKGSNLAAAKASGLMESIESYHAEHVSLPVRIASFYDLKEIQNVVDPDTLPRVKGAPFDLYRPIAWVESENLLGDGDNWIPYEMVHTNYTVPWFEGSGCFPASSNGLASGNSIQEATIHGICEVIERDALALWSLSGTAYWNRTSISIDTIESNCCSETLAKINAAELETYVWNITSDTGIPTYFALIQDKKSHTRHVGVGSGAHLSKEVALLRALHEAVQIRTTYIVGARDDLAPDEYTDKGIRSKREYFQKFVRASSFSGDFKRTNSFEADTLSDELHYLVAALRKIGVKSVLRVELTKPEFNIAVVRIVVPGLEAPHDEEYYVPGPRALSMQQKYRGFIPANY
jgi:ribosomal protein S12 methylthiotransferase accessory factor